MWAQMLLLPMSIDRDLISRLSKADEKAYRQIFD